jgi:hypothetical protein
LEVPFTGAFLSLESPLVGAFPSPLGGALESPASILLALAFAGFEKSVVGFDPAVPVLVVGFEPAVPVFVASLDLSSKPGIPGIPGIPGMPPYFPNDPSVGLVPGTPGFSPAVPLVVAVASLAGSFLLRSNPPFPVPNPVFSSPVAGFHYSFVGLATVHPFGTVKFGLVILKLSGPVWIPGPVYPGIYSLISPFPEPPIPEPPI